MVEQATGNFGEATTLRNLARRYDHQRKQAMHRPARAMKGPPTLSNNTDSELNQAAMSSETAISALA